VAVGCPLLLCLPKLTVADHNLGHHHNLSRVELVESKAPFRQWCRHPRCVGRAFAHFPAAAVVLLLWPRPHPLQVVRGAVSGVMEEGGRGGSPHLRR
jgi:hypothetical protein